MKETIQYKAGSPVSIQILDIDNYPWHFHEDVQLIYVLDGEVELKLTYTKYFLKKNSIHFIHTEDVHGFKGITKNNKVAVITLKSEYFSTQFPDLDNQIITTNIHSSSSTYKMLLQLRSQIFTLIWQRFNDHEDDVIKTANQLLDNLHRNFRGFTVDKNKKIFSHRVSHDKYQLERLSRVVSKIYRNYSSKLSLHDMAKEENINHFYLSHLFQNFTHENFRNFIGMVRVEMSEIKLLSTTFSIDEISHDVGFSNPKYYIENFIKWFGVHPNDYRRIYSKEILGIANIEREILPYEDIYTIIEEYVSIIETNSSNALIGQVSFDFKRTSANNNSTLWSDMFTSFKGDALSAVLNFQEGYGLDPASLYCDYIPQIECIKKLDDLISTKEISPLDLNVVDNDENINGLFTFNLMKKPMYFLFDFLRQMGEKIETAGDNSIRSYNNNKGYLILYNPDENMPLSFNISLHHVPGTLKVTEKRLLSQDNCIAFWCQLNFITNLAEEDLENIEAMSKPKVSYKIVPKKQKVSISKTLKPFEILFLKMEKL